MTLLHILTYASIVIFVIAIAVRAVRLASTPVHLRWELYPVAHEKDRVRYGGSYFEELDWWTKPRETSMFGQVKVMIPEVFLLKGIWEHNRSLWPGSFAMHVGLYLVIGLAGMSVVTAFAGLESGLGGILAQISGIIGPIGYILGVIGTLLLLLMRAGSHKLRNFTPVAAYFNLIFLFALFATGIYLFNSDAQPFATLTGYAAGLLAFSSDFKQTGIASAHVFIAVLFMMYLPFTHMTHFFTKYFTWHEVRWNDTPNLPGSKLEKAIQQQLGYPVSWAAPHLKADGKKNWADIATDTEVD